MQRMPVFKLPKNKTPKGTRCITITIPDDDEWEQLAYSSLYSQLAMWLCWERDADKWGTRIARQWKKALNTWRHCKTEPDVIYAGLEDDMPFFRIVCENNKSYLEFQSCPDEWVRLANVDQITANAQPGDGVPQPAPGQSQQICGTIYANQPGIVPFLVNSGDTISVTANGAGNDGGTLTWYCPDGSMYVAGVCDPVGKIFDGSDPLTTAYHMALVLKVGTNYYDLSSPVTLPSGISNAQATIQVNDSDLSNNAGSYQVCTTFQNNETPNWCFNQNLQTTSGEWAAFNNGAGILGTWVLSQGWTSQEGSPSHQYLDIKITFSPCAIDHLVVDYTIPPHSAGSFAIESFLAGTANGGGGVDSTVGAHTGVIVPINQPAVDEVRINLEAVVTTGDVSIASQIKFLGTGTIPSQFGSGNC